MTKDLNRGISEITYNLLNLPLKVDMKNPVAEARNEYTYSAGGKKLKVVSRWASSYSTNPVIGSAINTASLNNTKTTDYIGNFVYENGSLTRILTENGYYSNKNYYFYIRNHLGSNAIVADMNGNIVQQNHFYPFGQTMAISTGQGAQPYKFTGKELDLENGLNLYDFDARTYDTSVGRFTTVDPLAEKYYSISPYAYCANNPVKFVDIDGKKLYFAPGVSKEFKKQFAATVKYMNSKGTGGILKKINDSSKKVYIKEENGKSSFDPNTNTIKWDPDLGVITTNGTILSPATVLNHEADHANQNITNPEKQKTDENTPDANYSNKEEKRVIEGTEQTTARKHGEIEDGEVTRTNHSGVYYETKNPTTTEGKYEAVVTPEDIRKKNN